MHAFQFQTTKSIISEVGSTAKIGSLMADMGCQKIAFVTDKIILELGLADAALDSIKKAGLGCHIIDDVVADPPEEMILSAVEEAKAQGVDGVVSVGGGSSMDTAKLIAILVQSDQPIDEMYGVGLVKGWRLPLVLAPTTAGTGSEVTPISIVTTGSSEKKGVVSHQLLPDWAVLDAELTIGLPAHVTAATGIDAMVHAIEAYTSKHKKNIVSRYTGAASVRTAGWLDLRCMQHTSGSRSALQHVAGFTARRYGICQRAGSGRACACLSPGWPFPCASRSVKCIGSALCTGL